MPAAEQAQMSSEQREQLEAMLTELAESDPSLTGLLDLGKSGVDEMELINNLVTFERLNSNKPRQLIIYGLNYPADSVQTAVLGRVCEICDASELAQLPFGSQILDVICRLAMTGSGAVSDQSARFLLEGTKQCDLQMLEYLFKPETVSLLNGDGKSTTQMLRAAEFFCQIAAESKVGDILVRLNALEVLLTELCTAKHCFEWLEAEGVLAEMMQLLGDTDSNDAPYMIPATLRAVSKVLVHTNHAAEAFLERGLLQILVQLAAGQGAESELALLILGCCCILKLEAVLGVVTTVHEERAACLQAISNILQSESQELQGFVQRLDSSLGEFGSGLVGQLIKQSVQPVSQLQEASLSALSALVGHQWGADCGTAMVLNSPGAAESLVDRSHPEQSKEAKEWRYDCVLQMVLHRELFPSPELIVAFENYKKVGPYV